LISITCVINLENSNLIVFIAGSCLWLSACSCL